MSDKQEEQFEKKIRFVAKHYQEDRLDEKKAWQRFQMTHRIRRFFPIRRYLISIASILLLLIGTGTLIIWNQKSPEWIIISNTTDQTKDIYLPDNSSISLASHSSIKYDAKKYNKKRREVNLLGKAYFDVQKLDGKPFTVQTALSRVTVLGTTFQIREEQKWVEVNVFTGKVEFSVIKKDNSALLTAGMSARYDVEAHSIKIIPEEDINTLSWKTRRLEFQDTPVQKVIADLNEYYQTKIINKTLIKMDKRLTATFNDLPMEDVLMVINQTLDIHLISVSE